MPPLTLLIKPASGRCNLACRYCFYRDVAARRETEDKGLMTMETAARLIDAALDFSFDSGDSGGSGGSGRICSFAFQGGEPTLMGLEFFRGFVRVARSGAARRAAAPGSSGKALDLRFSIQTNGMLIDEEWAAFLEAEGFLTGLSMDGPALLHDACRVKADGSGSHAGALRAARLLAGAKADFNILCVVDSAIADNPLQVYDYFKRRGFNWLQFIPCLDPLEPLDPLDPLEPDAPKASAHSLAPEAYARFLKVLFDAWHADLRSGSGVSIRYFDNLVDMAMGYPPENCGMSGSCRAYPTIEADGSVYPCDFYVTDEWKLGNVRTDGFAALLSSPAARKFEESSLPMSPECGDCFAWPLCRGGCRRDREPFAGGEPSLNRLCAAYRDFFAHAGQRIMDLARSASRDITPRTAP